MPAEPGPIEVLDLAQFDLGPLPPGAALPTLPEEAEFDALALELEHDLAELAGGLGQDWRTELELLHVEAEEGVYHDPLTVDDAELAEVEGAALEADNQILAAYDEIPGQAWQDIPTPFEPPPETGGFMEEPVFVPPTPIVPPPTSVTQPPSPVAPTVVLNNLTRGGAALFYPGDSWELVITGPPVSLVTVTGYHNGVPFGPTAFGMTDASGRWYQFGAMSEYEIGSWVQQWYVAGQLCTPVVVFQVVLQFE